MIFYIHLYRRYKSAKRSLSRKDFTKERHLYVEIAPLIQPNNFQCNFKVKVGTVFFGGNWKVLGVVCTNYYYYPLIQVYLRLYILSI